MGVVHVLSGIKMVQLCNRLRTFFVLVCWISKDDNCKRKKTKETNTNHTDRPEHQDLELYDNGLVILDSNLDQFHCILPRRTTLPFSSNLKI